MISGYGQLAVYVSVPAWEKPAAAGAAVQRAPGRRREKGFGKEPPGRAGEGDGDGFGSAPCWGAVLAPGPGRPSPHVLRASLLHGVGLWANSGVFLTLEMGGG